MQFRPAAQFTTLVSAHLSFQNIFRIYVRGLKEVEAMQMVLSTGVSLVRNHLHVQLNREVQKT